MSANNRRGVSRRSFVRGAALGAAELAAASVPEVTADTAPAGTPKLSKVGEAQVEALFAGPGAHFTEAEKKDVVRLLTGVEQTSAKLAAFSLEENSDPALIFRAYRKEVK
jgi:hypothetical protein